MCTINKHVCTSEEIKNKVRKYPASEEIVINGDILDVKFHEVKHADSLKCSTIGDDTIKWKLYEGKTINSLLF